MSTSHRELTDAELEQVVAAGGSGPALLGGLLALLAALLRLRKPARK